MLPNRFNEGDFLNGKANCLADLSMYDRALRPVIRFAAIIGVSRASHYQAVLKTSEGYSDMWFMNADWPMLHPSIHT